MDGEAGQRQPPPFADTSGRTAATIDWLLDGDPSIRWQVLAGLTGAGQDEIDAERSRVAVQGWGAQLLAAQSADGQWAQALYSPKWTSTTYTLLLLHWLGLPSGHPQALAGCRQVWDGASFYGGGLTIAKSVREPETCITAMLILLASSFGLDDDRLDPTVAWLLDQQLADGGWNCESIRTGSRHGSFHTSISALEGLLRYQQSGGTLPVSESMHRGRTFFLDHHLYRSHRTGEVANPAFTRFPFPPQWHFDVLRGLDHFRAAGASADPRLGDAIDVVRRARRSDATWPLHRAHPGRTWFRMEPAGPSRWTTLRALRVLQWWGQDGWVADLQGGADHELSTESGQDRPPFG
jgi:hypothetical protein